jgi:hypothetical protein
MCASAKSHGSSRSSFSPEILQVLDKNTIHLLSQVDSAYAGIWTLQSYCHEVDTNRSGSAHL